MTGNPANNPSGLHKISSVTRIAVMLWLITLTIIFIRLAVSSGSHSVYPIYSHAGKNWLDSKPLYGSYKEPTAFVYSPTAAAFFAPFSLLPDFLGEVLWRLLVLAVCLSGIEQWLQIAMRRFFPPQSRALFYILLLPLSLAGLNNGQANCMVLGLLVWAIVAAENSSWCMAAFCIAAATCLKIYPIVVGLLLILIYPRQFLWRLLLFLFGLLALSFVLQHPAYVQNQYQFWFNMRLLENRRHWDDSIAPHDLWMVLKVLHLQISEHSYQVVQILSGAAIAAICLFGRLRNWPKDLLLFALFSMSCLWMILCGPATESSTYTILAPFLALTLINSFWRPDAMWMRVLIITAVALSITSFAINSFTQIRDPGWMSLQPIGAFLLFCYIMIRVLSHKEGFVALDPYFLGLPSLGLKMAGEELPVEKKYNTCLGGVDETSEL
jgi:hypothetical protein